MLTLGITGTLGAGKGTLVDYLIREKGFAHFSVRAYLLDEIRRRDLPENRDSMVVVANDLRKKHGPSFITDQLFIKAQHQQKPAVIESIRTPGEIISLRKEENFYLLAVDADPELRFSRIIQRKSETDRIDFDTFLQNEKREMNSDDPNKQNLQKCIQMADFLLINNQSIEQLNVQLEAILQKILA